eukprot:s274_g10.t2
MAASVASEETTELSATLARSEVSSITPSLGSAARMEGLRGRRSTASERRMLQRSVAVVSRLYDELLLLSLRRPKLGEATSLACRALTVQKSGRDDFPVGAGAYVLPTMPSASIERVKCLDEHEFRKLLGFRREPSEESNGLAVRHVWGMVPEDPPNSARPPKQTLLRGSSAGLDRARLGPVRFVKAGGLLFLPQPDKNDLQPRSKSGMWEKVRGMRAWAASRLHGKEGSKAAASLLQELAGPGVTEQAEEEIAVVLSRCVADVRRIRLEPPGASEDPELTKDEALQKESGSWCAQS